MNHSILADAHSDVAILDDLHATMDRYLDGLVWLPRQQAARTSTREGQRVHRTGPDFARGVRTWDLVPRGLTAECNRVLRRHGFQEQEVMKGSPSGHLRFTSTDGSGRLLHFWCKSNLEFWIDTPLKESPR